jgi:hypothetical protein
MGGTFNHWNTTKQNYLNNAAPRAYQRLSVSWYQRETFTGGWKGHGVQGYERIAILYTYTTKYVLGPVTSDLAF